MADRSDAPISSLAELARAAGVSTSTVSRALAGNAVISAETRARVNELARAHGFRPNQLARNLRLKRTQAIGVVLPLGHEAGQHLSDPFFLTMLGHLADAVTERGYDLLLSRVIPADDEWLDRLVDSGRVDGLIVIGQSDQAAVLDRVAARYQPLVVWGARLEGQVHCSVGTDNRLGGALAAERLIAGGRRRLAFFGPPDAPEIGQRQHGFAEACAAAGLAVETVPVHLTADLAFPAIAARLAAGDPPDGIAAASDVVAMAALRALGEAGLRVPDDVAVIGYDDVPLAAHTNPPLTTIRQDTARGSALLVDLLLRRLGGETGEPLVLPPELVVRGSA